MLDGWAGHPAVIQTLAEVSEALNQDIASLIHDGPREALALTENTQPVMLAAGIAAFRVWMSEVGVPPNAVAGHSLGEYCALVAAGALTVTQAAPLVRMRAQAMQAAVPVGEGAMAAILGLDAGRVIEGCREATDCFGQDSLETVEAANFNDPAQTVISGSKLAVDKACEILKAAGAKRTLILPVSAPFHSSLMKPAADLLKQRLEEVEFATPKIALINNIDVAVEVDADRIRDALYRQAFGPVRWVECVEAIRARDITHIVECGPGKVLAGLAKRIDDGLTGLPLLDTASLAQVSGVLA
jgi:[acyl-carrier-protein] S-malonyltransferase